MHQKKRALKSTYKSVRNLLFVIFSVYSILLFCTFYGEFLVHLQTQPCPLWEIIASPSSSANLGRMGGRRAKTLCVVRVWSVVDLHLLMSMRLRLCENEVRGFGLFGTSCLFLLYWLFCAFFLWGVSQACDSRNKLSYLQCDGKLFMQVLCLSEERNEVSIATVKLANYKVMPHLIKMDFYILRLKILCVLLALNARSVSPEKMERVNFSCF